MKVSCVADIMLTLYTTCRLLVMYNRARKAKGRYDLGNYIATENNNVQLLSYKTLPWDAEEDHRDAEDHSTTE